MGEFIDKTKGAANEAIGKVKVAAGKSTENPEMIVSGAKQQIAGKAQKASGAIKGTMGDKV
jgi:uncharacterized protein YjbJ (UPF0337 family)